MIYKSKLDMNYLLNKPKKIGWKVIAGGKLSQIQRYDLIFDDYDLKIRQLEHINFGE